MSKTKPTQSPPPPAETDLPEGWALASLGDGLILDVQPGFACGMHNREGQGIGHLRPMNVSSEGAIDLSNLKFVPTAEADREERLVNAGDVIFNNTNSAELVGKTACYLLADPLAFSNHMTRLRCRLDAVEPQFCSMQLHQRWREGHFEEVCNHHVSQASVGRKVLLETAFLLPPLPEQKRIVAKVEALLERVNAARARLARLPAILKRFRQSVLAASCSGQLTADVAKAESGEWQAVALGTLIVDGFQNGLYKPRSAYGRGVPIVRIANFYDGIIDPLDQLERLEVSATEARTYRLWPDDLLVNRVNSMAFLGKSALVGGLAEPYVFESNMMRFRVDGERILPQYLIRFLNSLRGLEELRRNAKLAVNLVAAGKLSRFYVGRLPRIARSEIERFIAEGQTKGENHESH